MFCIFKKYTSSLNGFRENTEGGWFSCDTFLIL